MVSGVEESTLAGALALDEVAGHGRDEPVALGVAFLRDARSEIGLAVAVQVLAVERPRDRQVVLPGPGRLEPGLLEQVAPVVGHLEVAIERDGVDVAFVGGAEVAEEGRDVVPLQRIVALHPIRQHLEVARLDEVPHPLGREHGGVVAVGAGREVGEQLVVEVREGDRDHLHLGAGELREVRRAPLQGLRDLRAGEGDDVHGHPLERLLGRDHRACRGGDQQGGHAGER